MIELKFLWAPTIYQRDAWRFDINNVYIYFFSQGFIAQLVEQYPEKVCVGGSSPPEATIKNYIK